MRMPGREPLSIAESARAQPGHCNHSARSRPLAPSQPPLRIAIASDVPPRGRKFGIATEATQWHRLGSPPRWIAAQHAG